jgi:(4S)-4-hydroxy-5-phosphonooxypentane-2,3-dione isomerase
MLKPVSLSAAAAAMAVTAWMLLPMPSQKASAQSGPLFINLVELDIVPAEFDKYMAAIKENGAAAVKEPGCREFNVTVSQKDPHHVMLFEVYDSAAALDAHRGTEHFKKYQATTKDMVAKRNVQAYSSVVMNMKGM